MTTEADRKARPFEQLARERCTYWHKSSAAHCSACERAEKEYEAVMEATRAHDKSQRHDKQLCLLPELGWPTCAADIARRAAEILAK